MRFLLMFLVLIAMSSCQDLCNYHCRNYIYKVHVAECHSICSIDWPSETECTDHCDATLDCTKPKFALENITDFVFDASQHLELLPYPGAYACVAFNPLWRSEHLMEEVMPNLDAEREEIRRSVDMVDDIYPKDDHSKRAELVESEVGNLNETAATISHRPNPNSTNVFDETPFMPAYTGKPESPRPDSSKNKEVGFFVFFLCYALVFILMLECRRDYRNRRANTDGSSDEPLLPMISQSSYIDQATIHLLATRQPPPRYVKFIARKKPDDWIAQSTPSGRPPPAYEMVSISRNSASRRSI